MSKPLHNRPVNSGHLTRLEIHGITVYERFLDFSNCPSLEHLEFDNCFFYFDTRFHISAPSLVSLVLRDISGMFPKLESMPSLVKAVVKIIEDTLDSCFYYNCHCEFCDNSHSIGDGTGSNNSVLLKGLSEVKDLALTSETKTVLLPFHLYLNYIMSFHYWWGGFFFLFAFLVANRTFKIKSCLLHLFLLRSVQFIFKDDPLFTLMYSLAVISHYSPSSAISCC